MTRFGTSNINFGYRVAGILLHDKHVLLQGEPQGALWTLPGGGVELLEQSQAALKREMQEKLGVDIRIERLLWVVEHFFVSDGDVPMFSREPPEHTAISLLENAFENPGLLKRAELGIF